MFSYITKNWRAKPLESLEVIVNLIANTTTLKGLTIKAKADKNQYEKGLKVDDEELKKINLTNKEFRGDWNYKISPWLYQLFFNRYLGLSLAYDIIKAHGGEIKVETKEGEGLSADLSDEALAKSEALAQAGSEFVIQLPA